MAAAGGSGSRATSAAADRSAGNPGAEDICEHAPEAHVATTPDGGSGSGRHRFLLPAADTPHVITYTEVQTDLCSGRCDLMAYTPDHTRYMSAFDCCKPATAGARQIPTLAGIASGFRDCWGQNQ